MASLNTLEKEIETAVRKVVVDEAAAKAIQVILDTPEGTKMIDRVARQKALDIVKEMQGKNVLTEGEAKTIEAALAKNGAAPADAKK